MEIADATTKVFFFVATLGYSRRLHVRAFGHEKQESWFGGMEAHLEAWIREVADTPIHGPTGEAPARHPITGLPSSCIALPPAIGKAVADLVAEAAREASVSHNPQG